MTSCGLSRIAAVAFPFLVALLVRVAAAWVSHGEPVVDVASFHRWAEHLDAGRNPYTAESFPANYPPIWVWLCWLCLLVSLQSGLSFDLVAKLLVSVVDAATVVPVARLVWSQGGTDGQSRIAALGYALNPAAILIASFHAQNDPIVVGLVLWSCWLVSTAPVRFAAETGALLLGVSLGVKPLGVLFVPLILARVSGWGRRAGCFALVLLPLAIASLPYLIESPGALVEAAASLRGPPDFGWLGIYNSWKNFGLASSGEPVISAVPVRLRLAFLAVAGLVWWRFRRAELVEQIIAVILSFYLVYGALGAQYLMWVMPFAAAARTGPIVRVSALTALALVAFYELHHPGMLSGSPSPGSRVFTIITLPQWSGIFLFAQVFLYANWGRWMWHLLQSHPVWSAPWRE